MAQEKIGATVHLFCGLPTSGKTTLAKELEQTQHAIRFSLDEWMIDLTEATIFDAEYGEMAEKLKERFWQTAVPILNQGVDVILDWSLWSRERRQKWIGRIIELGADYTLYYLNIPPVVLRQRLEAEEGEELVHRLQLDAVFRTRAAHVEKRARHHLLGALHHADEAAVENQFYQIIESINLSDHQIKSIN